VRAALEAVPAAVAETGATDARVTLQGVFEPLAGQAYAERQSVAYAPEGDEPYVIEVVELTIGTTRFHCQFKRAATAAEAEVARGGGICSAPSYRAEVL